MAHTDKRIWEYLRLSRSTDPITTANPASADNRGQLTVYREPGAQDLLYLSRQTSAGPGFYEWTTAMFAQDDATLLQYGLTDGVAIIVAGSLESTTAPTLTGLTVNGGIVVNGGVRIGGSGLATITTDTSAGNTAGIANKGGGEYNGYFELTANGTGISTGQVAHVAYANALGNVDYNVILQDYAGNFVGVRAYARDLATTGFHVGFNTAPVAGTVYKIGYTVIGWPS